MLSCVISSITALKRETENSGESQPLRPMRSTEGQREARRSQRSHEAGQSLQEDPCRNGLHVRIQEDCVRTEGAKKHSWSSTDITGPQT